MMSSRLSAVTIKPPVKASTRSLISSARGGATASQALPASPASPASSPTVVAATAAANYVATLPAIPSDLSGLDARALVNLFCSNATATTETEPFALEKVATAALAHITSLELQRDEAVAAAASSLIAATTSLATTETLKQEQLETRGVLAALAAAATDTRCALDAARTLDAATRAQIKDLLLQREQYTASQSSVSSLSLSSNARVADAAGYALAEDRAAAADVRAYDGERALAAARAETSYWRHRAERAEALSEQLSGVIASQNDALADAAYAGEDRLRVSDADWRRARVACGLLTEAEEADEIVAHSSSDFYVTRNDTSDRNNISDRNDVYRSDDDTNHKNGGTASPPVSDDEENRSGGSDDSNCNSDTMSRLHLRGEMLLRAFGARGRGANANASGSAAPRRLAPAPRSHMGPHQG